MGIFEQAQMGDSEAFKELFEQYRPVLQKYQHRFFLIGFAAEDVEQEARIVFYQSLRHFDTKHSAAFGSFYSRALSNRLISLIRYQAAFKRQTDYLSTSLERISEEHPEYLTSLTSNQTPEQEVLLQELLEEFTHFLSDFELQVFQLLQRGLALEQIAQQLAVSSKKFEVRNPD